MLTTQDFSRKRLFVLGTDFFALGGAVGLDYLLAMRLRVADAIQEQWDFHCWDIDTDATRSNLAILQGWGVPLQEGMWLPETVTKESKRRVDVAISLLAGGSCLHASNLSAVYRLQGRNNYSLCDPLTVMDALQASVSDPNPFAFEDKMKTA